MPFIVIVIVPPSADVDGENSLRIFDERRACANDSPAMPPPIIATRSTGLAAAVAVADSDEDDDPLTVRPLETLIPSGEMRPAVVGTNAHARSRGDANVRSSGSRRRSGGMGRGGVIIVEIFGIQKVYG